MKFQNKAIAVFLLSCCCIARATNRPCEDTSVVFVSAISPDDAGLEEGFELFRDLLGGDNNGNDVAGDKYGWFKEGHRQVNWDAPIVPFDMPGDFFAATVTRGMTVSSLKDEFRVSNPVDSHDPWDNLFDSISAVAAEDFQTFSPKRLFTPLGHTTFTVDFTVPGFLKTPATVEGFGAVFVDVDTPGTTKMTFYAKSGCVIAEEYVKPSADGLSFLGAYSSNYPIYTVEIQAGSKAIDDKSHKRGDFVVMDDFLFSEPQGY